MKLESLKAEKFNSLNESQMNALRGGNIVTDTGDGSTVRLPGGRDVDVFADRFTAGDDGSPIKMEYQIVRGGAWNSFNY